MEIIKKSSHPQVVAIGRMSDGSDRQNIAVTTVVVEFEVNDRLYTAQFDHDPTEDELLNAQTQGHTTEITTIEFLSAKVAKQQALIDLLILSALEGV